MITGSAWRQGGRVSPLAAYAVALAATAAMVALRYSLDPWLGEYLPLATVYGAIAVAVWIGGAGPAVLAATLGYLACDWLFIAPRGVIAVGDARNAIGLALYGLSAAVIVGFGAAMRRARHGADSDRQRLQREVVERERAEREAQRAQQRSANVLASITDGFYQLDHQWRYVAFNGQAEKYFGKPTGELLGRVVWEVFPEKKGSAFELNFRRALADRQAAHFEALSPALKRWVEVHAYPGDDGLNVFFHDVTERKQAELEVQRLNRDLQRHNERLRLLSRAAAVLLHADDPDRMLREVFREVAPHFEIDLLFNYLVDDTGQALRLATCIGLPEETARSIGVLAFGEAICGTVAQQRQPLVVARIQDGDLGIARLVKSFGVRAFVCNPLLAGERLLGTLSFASRTRERFDDDEIEFLATICRYVSVAYERLLLTRSLREADRRKDEFLAMLAHELRNLLAPLSNTAHALALKRGADPALERTGALIERQVSRMARLMDDLLDLSRITPRKLELRRDRVALAAVIDSALETSRPLIEARRHRLEVELPDEPLRLDADPMRLAQVFANLLNNAAKYTEPGGTIRLSAQRGAHGTVRVRVHDNGIGIAPTMLPRVFELFAQDEAAVPHAQGGMGIGLALAKGLVELHGGAIEARSAGPGLGSEFVVTLPLEVEEPLLVETPAGPAETCDAAQASQRVLVVDDSTDSGDSLAALLRSMGHEVRIAYDGEQGVALAEVFRPQLMLLDLRMPRLDGFAACRAIRSRPWGRSVRLVALSGFGREEDRTRTRAAGFDEHLMKPVEVDALRALLGTASAAVAPEDSAATH